jgi:glycosyltransferase involved in cell wall biosynthesis/GT2 family glycosyltransferase
MFDHKSPNFALTPVAPERPRYNYAAEDETAWPLVSIVTPFFNTGEEFLATATSVLAQSLQQFEWIVIDDGSTDPRSKEMLAKVRASDRRISVIEQENKGCGAARNQGFRAARAQFVVPLDADDLLEPTALEKWMWYLATHPQAAFVNGFSIGFGRQQYVWQNGFHEGATFLTHNRVTPEAMIRRFVHGAVNGYDETKRGGLEDWDFWLRCASAGYWGVTLPEACVWYRRRDDHSDRWSDWTDDGLRRFVNDAKQRHPELYRKGFDPNRPRPIGPKDSVTRLDASQGANKLAKRSSRLLLVVPWFELGGADQFNLNLIDQLHRLGWEITVVATLPSKHPWLGEFAKRTQDIFILDHFLEIADVPEFLEYLTRSRNPDAILVSHCMTTYRLLPFLRSKFPHLPIVDYVHNVDMTWENGGFPAVSARNSGHIDLHITSCDQVRRWMVDRGVSAQAIETCTINVSRDAFAPNVTERRCVRQSLGIHQGTSVILFAGRIVEQKRPLLAMEVVRRVATCTRDFRFVVAGDGPLLAEMQSFAKKHDLDDLVTFTGRKTNAEVAGLMRAADIFFLPSAYEGIALSLYEAMASGVAVLGANVGGQAEVVGGDCGRLVDPVDDGTDAAEFSSVLLSWLADPEYIRDLGKRGRARIERDFTLDKMGDQMNRLLLEGIRRGSLAQRVPPTKWAVLNSRAMAACTFGNHLWKLNWPIPSQISRWHLYVRIWLYLFRLA